MAALEPIVDYDTLIAAVKSVANRSDLEYTDSIPLFIQQAEIRLFRNLRVPGNEKQGQWLSSVYDNTKGISIPNDYLEIKLLFYGEQPLERVSDQRLAALLAKDRTPAAPRYFARIADVLSFYPVPATNEDVFAVYYEFQGPLSGGESWTKMLKIAPYAYLYGALGEGARFIRDKEEAASWDERFNNELASLAAQAIDNEVAGSTVVTSDFSYGDQGVW